MAWSGPGCSSHHRDAVTASGRGTWDVLWRSAGCIRLPGLRERASSQGLERGLLRCRSRAHSRSDSGGGGARSLPLRLKGRMPRCCRVCAGLCCVGLIAAVVGWLLVRRLGGRIPREGWRIGRIRGSGTVAECGYSKGKVWKSSRLRVVDLWVRP